MSNSENSKKRIPDSGQPTGTATGTTTGANVISNQGEQTDKFEEINSLPWILESVAARLESIAARLKSEGSNSGLEPEYSTKLIKEVLLSAFRGADSEDDQFVENLLRLVKREQQK